MAIPVKGLMKAAKVVAPIVASAAPMVKDVIDQQNEAKKDYIQLPNLVDMRLTDAIGHLERLHFVPQEMLVEPHKKYLTKKVDYVLQMDPKPGKYPEGTLVKIYYMNADILDQCDDQVELPKIKGLDLEAATELLTNKGFEVVTALAKPHKNYADDHNNCVVDFEPKPALFTNNLRRGTTITLHYVNDVIIEKSQHLLEAEKAKQASKAKVVDDGVKAIGDGINNLKGIFGKK
ncbi:PASTA domain-containing protein [Streptococcus merionis]|uniref:PASTA domain n=1 Tax=Streptococcus merionis TaxID=400065 RepID=A0A239SS07_9STRE|nr:PASTA domain-containing protein [Streptococcus merionis]SNU87433.1 PASTA domain [Streptococcus merionis]